MSRSYGIATRPAAFNITSFVIVTFLRLTFTMFRVSLGVVCNAAATGTHLRR
jgi:hypothetical protein